MRDNTKFLIAAFFFTFVVIVNIGLIKGQITNWTQTASWTLIILVSCAYVAGVYLALGFASHGEVTSFKELANDAYTYLGSAEDVYILKRIDSAGKEFKFAISDLHELPQFAKLKVSDSFRKINKDSIVIL